jgi:ring-1,2-phenylacetyl-CoA epoxidase subunit PaaE
MRAFRPLRIAAISRETAEVIAVTLAVPEQWRAEFLAFRPGQHVGVRAIVGGEELRRSYSICGGTSEGLRIAIKRVSGGRFSHWAHKSLQPGDELEVLPPAGRFLLADAGGAARHVVAFAAGVGITPIIAIVRHALELEPQTSVTLVFGNRTPDSVLFAAELEDLKDRHLGRFTLLNVLSRSGESGPPLLEGRITGAKVKALAGSAFMADAVAHFYVCGPGAMIGAVRDALRDLGVARAQIHHEFFTPAPLGDGAPPAPVPVGAVAQQQGSVDADERAEATEAIAVLDGIERRFMVPRGGRVVDAALAAGIRVPYSCKGGMCCTCRAKLVAGKVEMVRNYSLEPWELALGFVLTCQAVPVSQRIVVDYDCM